MSRVLFGGKVLREPTAAAQLRVGVQPSVNPNATNRVAVIGPSDGGLPNTKYTFSSFAEAREILRGGDGLKAVANVFNPSPVYGGAAQIDFIRAQAATAATLNLMDATGGSPLIAVTLTSKDMGLWTNGIQVTVAAGVTDSSARVLTVKVPSIAIQKGTDGVLSSASNVYSFSSPSAKFLSRGAKIGDAVQVSGQTAANLSVMTIKSITSETTVVLNETPAPTSATGLTWQHFQYGRVQVSPEIQAMPGSTNINTNIVTWVNTYCADVLSAVLGVGGSAATMAIATGAINAMAGATETALTNNDITAALTVLRTADVRHITVAKACGTEGTELEFAGLLRGHLLSDAERPAIGYIGAKADKTIAAAITYAGTLNSARLVYCPDTGYDAALDGLSTDEVPGYLIAAKAAGLAAGLPPQTPLTRKPLALLGLKAFPTGQRDKATRESMLQAGCFVLFQPSGSNTIVVNQGLTTLQANDSVWDLASSSSSEISLMRIVDTILDDLRQSAAATFVGSVATLTKPVVEHFVQAYLDSQVGGLLASYNVPTITQNQDKWMISFGMVPNYPVNFILLTGTVIG